MVDRGTGYVTGNVITVDVDDSLVTLTFTDSIANGIIDDGELVAPAIPNGYYVGSVESWTTGQMPAPMICAPERCSWDETGARITTNDVPAGDPNDCKAWGYKGLGNCQDQSEGNPWSSTSTPPGLCGSQPAKYCSQSMRNARNNQNFDPAKYMCEASKCSDGVFTPGAKCREKMNCRDDFDHTTCPAGSSDCKDDSCYIDTECQRDSCTM